MNRTEDRRQDTEDRRRDVSPALRANVPLTRKTNRIRVHSRPPAEASAKAGAFAVSPLHPSSSPASGGQVLHPSSNRGIALILTLAVITLVTLLLIGFAVSMRVENTASKNFNDVIKARELANAAVDEAVATIRQATTRDGVTISNYVTFPGAVYYYNGATTTRIQLCSTNAAAITDINQDFWITANNGEFPGAGDAVINVGWNNVAEHSGPPGPGNPLIGRFAFWVDDEASKININTAGQNWTPPDLYGASDPLAVDLTQLWTPPFLYAADIASGGLTYPRGIYPYTTAQEIERANPSITPAMFDANRFSMTAYSDDASGGSDDLDALGRTRLILGNLHHLVGDSDIEGTAGGGISNAYVRLTDTVLQNVYSSTAHPDGFKSKYTDIGLKQIIANIIAYQINPTNTPPPDDSILPIPNPIPNAPAYLGLAKTPYISEVQVRYVFSGTPPNYHVTRTVTVELFNMYDTSFTGQAGDEVRVDLLPNVGGLPTTVTVPVGAGSIANGTAVAFASADGDVDFANPLGQITLLGKPISATYTRNYAVEGTRRLDFAAMSLPTVVVTPISGTHYQDCELIGDPAVNELNIPAEWQPRTDAGGLGAYTYPAGDTSKSVIMRGANMQSVGELGYIHLPGILWGHLTLRPGGGNTGANQIPDWAMLDIFTVGNTVIPNVTRGRININSLINPGASPVAPTTHRLVPLKALLNSISTLTPAEKDTAALNIYVDGGAARATADAYGMNVSPDYIFDTIGEICEINSLIPASATTDADKEAVIRRIANLITVRSNTFTIWVIAQSIKQPTGAAIFTPGVDVITGEVRAQAVVERIQSPGTDGVYGTGDDTVRFRVRYFRYM